MDSLDWTLALRLTHCVSGIIARYTGTYAAEDTFVANEIGQTAKHIAAHVALIDEAALLAEQTTHLYGTIKLELMTALITWHLRTHTQTPTHKQIYSKSSFERSSRVAHLISTA